MTDTKKLSDILGQNVVDFVQKATEEAPEQPNWLKVRCRECGDSGWSWDQSKGSAVRCEACRVPIEERLRLIGVPELESASDLMRIPADIAAVSSRIPQLAASFVRYIENDHQESVLLMGQTGTGKTFIAAGICRQAVMVRIKCRFVHLPKWFRLLKDSYGDGRLSESTLFQPLLDAQLLVMDELGTRDTATEWAISQLLEVLHHRISAKKRTVLTTNLRFDPPSDPNEKDESIPAIYGDRVASRLKTFVRIPVDGPDLRGRK